MKKLLSYLFTIMLSFSVISATVMAAKKDKAEEKTTTETKEVKDEKATLYLFRQTGCPHCADEMSYLDANLNKYQDKFNIVVYDIYESGNRDLVMKVCEALGVEYEGAPFNVVGKQTYVGFADSIADDFDSFLTYVYEAKEEDVVAKVLSKNKDLDVKSTTLAEAMDLEGIEHSNSSSEGSKSGKSSDTAIIVCIFAGVVLATGALIYFSRKK